MKFYKKDILHDLYYGNYESTIFERKKDSPADREKRETADALLAALPPEQKELFYRYEDAENVHCAYFGEQAFKDGFRLAVQMILSGCGTADVSVSRKASVFGS